MSACPNCGSAMPVDAVQCVGCGYRLKVRPRGAALDESQTSPNNENPYSTETGSSPGLTEEAEGRAASVIAAADSFELTLTRLCVLAVLFGLCAPLSLLVLPWTSYHYMRWRRLNREFAELQHATSFSPRAELAADFQSAGSRLRRGIGFGAVAWAVLGIVIMVRLLVAYAPR